jgi:hypothetical protein
VCVIKDRKREGEREKIKRKKKMRHAGCHHYHHHHHHADIITKTSERVSPQIEMLFFFSVGEREFPFFLFVPAPKK